MYRSLLSKPLLARDWNADYDHDTLITTGNITTLEERHQLLKLSILYQIINGQLMIPGAPIERRIQQRSLRNTTSTLLQRPVTHTNAHLYLFFPNAIALWNDLGPSVQMSDPLYF